MPRTATRVTILAISATLFASGVASGQTGTLTGVVLGESRQGLPGATVSILHTQLTAVSDANGRFVIPGVPTGDRDLRITHIESGVRHDRIRIASGDTTRAEYAMAESDATSDSSAAGIDAAPEEVPLTTGVMICIRRPALGGGPIYIIDEVIVPDGATASLALELDEIDTVEILDAETAARDYGSRATHGVIIVTMKDRARPPHS